MKQSKVDSKKKAEINFNVIISTFCFISLSLRFVASANDCNAQNWWRFPMLNMHLVYAMCTKETNELAIGECECFNAGRLNNYSLAFLIWEVKQCLWGKRGLIFRKSCRFYSCVCNRIVIMLGRTRHSNKSANLELGEWTSLRDNILNWTRIGNGCAKENDHLWTIWVQISESLPIAQYHSSSKHLATKHTNSFAMWSVLAL